MPDEYVDLKSSAADKDRDPDKDDRDKVQSSWWLGRWAHVLTIPVWFILFVALNHEPWGDYVAVAVAYTVFVFCLAIGNAFEDSDDYLGNSKAVQFTGILLIPHALVLLLLAWCLSEWFHLATVVPPWVTHEGRKGSLWYWCGMIPLSAAGYWQGMWMATQFRRRFGKRDE
jgi:hypothetical protein